MPWNLSADVCHGHDVLLARNSGVSIAVSIETNQTLGEPESASRKLTDKLRERLEMQYPEATMIERDLVKDKLPHLDPLKRS